MSWDQFPAEVSHFAQQLRRDSQTKKTGEALVVLHSQFANGWKKGKKVQTSDAGIPLPLPRVQGLHPAGCTLDEAFLSFTFEASSVSRPKSDFQVRVTGQLAVGATVVQLEDHWRVDTDFAAVFTAREPHPPYHFQRGGHAQDAFAQHAHYVPGPALPNAAGAQWCALLQSPGPRILMPPMCPILALDFAISQHDGVTWKRLRGKPEYLGSVEKSQQRLWVPFFSDLNDPDKRRDLLGPLLAIR